MQLRAWTQEPNCPIQILPLTCSSVTCPCDFASLLLVSVLLLLLFLLPSPSSPAHITKGPCTECVQEAQPGSRAQCGPRWPGLAWLGAGSGLQRIQEVPEIQEISLFLRKAQILKTSLGSRKTGLDSALGAARCHPLPSLFQMSTWICIEPNAKAVFLFPPSLYAFGMETS